MFKAQRGTSIPAAKYTEAKNEIDLNRIEMIKAQAANEGGPLESSEQLSAVSKEEKEVEEEGDQGEEEVEVEESNVTVESAGVEKEKIAVSDEPKIKVDEKKEEEEVVESEYIDPDDLIQD